MTEQPCARRCAGLSDPTRTSSGAWHPARTAVRPDSRKRDLGAATAKTFLQGLSGSAFTASRCGGRRGWARKDRAQVPCSLG